MRGQGAHMSHLRVAVISRDEHVRLEAARAFDSAPADWLVGLYKEPPADADVVVFGPDVPGASGIVFDPAHPGRVVDEVRSAAENDQPSSPVVAVTSCNRGAGVTTLGLHLARALGARRNVCYVDLDTDWSAAPRLGLDPHALLTWGDLDDEPEAVRRCALPLEHSFRILFAPSGGDPDEGVAVVGRATGHFEAVVVDVPLPTATPDVLALASAGVFLLPPTRPAALRARALLCDGQWEGSWAVVTNRLGRGSELRQAEIERLIDRPVALALPHAPRLRDAEDGGRLLSSTLWRWRRRVDRLAGARERALEAPSDRESATTSDRLGDRATTSDRLGDRAINGHWPT